MPKAEASYIYQFKICETANKIAADLVHNFDPNEANRFVLIFNNNYQKPEFLQLIDKIDYFKTIEDFQGSEQSFIFIDNFDPNMYTYVVWNNIPQKQMENLIEEPFTEKDFVNFRTKEVGCYKDRASVMMG